MRARRRASEKPQIGAPYFHETRIVPFRKYPYGLVYVTRGALVIGIAVCHFSRRPGYWKRRVPEGEG